MNWFVWRLMEMKILKSTKKSNNDETIKKVCCPDCNCEYEIDIEKDNEYYIKAQDGEIAKYICPECGAKFFNEDRLITKKNITFPCDFYHFGKSENALEISKEEITENVRKLVKKVLKDDVGSYYYTARGDTFIIAAKYEDEIVVWVSKDYYEGNIDL